MKNIQVIDGAENCTYSIFSCSDEDFYEIFVRGTDIEFVEDFFERAGEVRAVEITSRLWNNRVTKEDVRGIHGTIFYQLQFKKKYYPTKRAAEILGGDG